MAHRKNNYLTMTVHKRSFAWWLLIGWWWRPILHLFWLSLCVITGCGLKKKIVGQIISKEGFILAICTRCSCSFDVSNAKRIIGRKYGAGTYDDFYSNDVCESCARDELGSASLMGADVLKDARKCGWDDDE